MLTTELEYLREKALEVVVSANRPCATQEIARHLFGARFHEDPVAHLIVRILCKQQPGLFMAHDQNWLATDSPHIDIPLSETRFVVVDLETTGSLIGVDRIIEVGVAVMEGGKIVQQFSSLVSTRRHLSRHILKLTGIRTADLKDAPAFSEVAPIVVGLLQGAHAFVGHGVQFDFSFLRWELARHGYDMPNLTGVCTLELTRKLWPDLGGWKLKDLAESFAIAHANPHRAGEDALATAGVLQHAVEEAQRWNARTLGDLIALTSKDAASIWHGDQRAESNIAG
jgi:DNA polymerase III epsilon subunit family exonuclease